MITWQEISLRLVVAALLGSLIGLERERLDRGAGLRTHMLVCLGSALIMIVSAFGFADILGTPNVVLDPSRVAAQVVSGIGFIGAGTIIFLRHEVIKGITTAAGLWTVAAIGLAVGGGMYVAAMITAVLALIILLVLNPLTKRYFSKYQQRNIKLIIHREEFSLKEIHAITEEWHLALRQITVQKTDQPELDIVRVIFTKANNKKSLIDVTDRLNTMPGVREAFLTIE